MRALLFARPLRRLLPSASISSPARAKIKNDFKVIQSWSVCYGPALFVLLVIATGLSGFWAVETYHPWGNDVKGTEALTAVLGLGVFLIGFHQWRRGRQEASLERYYDRLKLANDARNCLTDKNLRIDPLHMYVYVELDNLEYVLQKYQLGYMAPEHALRGFKTFDTRSQVDGFKEYLKDVGNLTEHAGYQQETCKLVEHILSNVIRGSTA